MVRESEDLATHVSLCELRYKQLEGRMDAVEQRIAALAHEVADIKESMQQGLHEIRLLIEKQNNARTTQMIAATGGVIVAIITLLGYIITR